MKPGARSTDYSKTPEGVSEELFRLSPTTYKGYNLLAGKAVLLAIHNRKITKGAEK